MVGKQKIPYLGKRGGRGNGHVAIKKSKHFQNQKATSKNFYLSVFYRKLSLWMILF